MSEAKLMIQGLREAGLRITPQRIAIYRSLVNNPAHPTAQKIFEELRPEYPSLSLTTVYNTLETLLKLGAINVMNNVGDAPTRFDANTSPHAHLHCIQCNELIDFTSQHVPALDADIETHSDYRILGSHLLYYGLCANCQQENQNS